MCTSIRLKYHGAVSCGNVPLAHCVHLVFTGPWVAAPLRLVVCCGVGYTWARAPYGSIGPSLACIIVLESQCAPFVYWCCGTRAASSGLAVKCCPFYWTAMALCCVPSGLRARSALMQWYGANQYCNHGHR